MPKTVLFVCTGNTCRSYMAQMIARDYLEKQKKQLATELKIISAGTGAFAGDPPSVEAKQVLKEMGINEELHRAGALSPELIREADLILAMTARHKDKILLMEPQASDKVYLLTEFAWAGQRQQEAGEIADPYGGSLGQYRDCAAQISAYVSKALDNYLQGITGDTRD